MYEELNLMRIKKPNAVAIQFKSYNPAKSKSFTVYDGSIDDVYDKVKLLFEELERNKGDVQITFIQPHDEKTTNE